MEKGKEIEGSHGAWVSFTSAWNRVTNWLTTGLGCTPFSWQMGRKRSIGQNLVPLFGKDRV